MKLKSYFANSVQDAIEKARHELGPDAMLVRSNETGSELRDLGRYEVVFGVSSSVPSASRTTSSANAAAPVESNAVLQELAEMRRQLELVTQTVARNSEAHEMEQWQPELAGVCQRLIAAGFSPSFAHDVTQAVAVTTKSQSNRSSRAVRDPRDPFTRDLLHALTQDEISSRFETNAILGRPNRASDAIMLIGPPGAGKTTSIMKLGLRYGVKHRRPIQLVSLDTLRIGGFHQLSTYARICGAEFRPVQHPSTLEQAITAQFPNTLTLIDTPGFAVSDQKELETLAETARALDIEVQLVLPGYASLAAARQICRRLSAFGPSKLILTHTDSVEQKSALIELASQAGLPLSFLGTGQQVPEDLEEADKKNLTRDLLPQSLAVASMAA
jgi:flagellar biosynthesis protein FlhF